MTSFQKAVCSLLSLIFFYILATMPGFFQPERNVYRKLPLYCFLERESVRVPEREDPETYEKIIADNAAYLSMQVQEENGADKPIPAAPEVPAVTEAPVVTEDNEVSAVTEAPEDSADTEMPAVTEGLEASDMPVLTEAPADTEMPAVTDAPEAPDEPAVTEAPASAEAVMAMAEPRPAIDLSPELLADSDYLMEQFYIVDENTAPQPGQLNASQFLSEDLTLRQNASEPQILIYHSHSQEDFTDSRQGMEEDTIVGVGDYLTEILTDTYGYQVIHVKEVFDVVDGQSDRSKAYDYARAYIEQVLEENPSIQVVIDLHRDGVPEDRHLVTTINGKDTAQIMFYNGLSYTLGSGVLDYLPNPYIQDNLAFSFQLEYQAALYYPGLYRGIYLAGYRYNLHLRPRAILLEAGAQNNTVQEVKNAMEPFAHILHLVLFGDGVR